MPPVTKMFWLGWLGSACKLVSIMASWCPKLRSKMFWLGWLYLTCKLVGSQGVLMPKVTIWRPELHSRLSVGWPDSLPLNLRLTVKTFPTVFLDQQPFKYLSNNNLIIFIPKSDDSCFEIGVSSHFQRQVLHQVSSTPYQCREECLRCVYHTIRKETALWSRECNDYTEVYPVPCG